MKSGSSKSALKKFPTKRRYPAPRVVPLTVTAAKAELEAKGVPGDPGVQEMLKRINQVLSKKSEPGGK